MAQIKKDKKQSDNQRISSLTQENDNLFQSADIEQSKKDQAKAVVNFAQQVINAEGFKNRDLRLYNLGIQEAVNKILKGEQAYSDSMTGDAKTNIFGYYSRYGQPSELDWMVNETVKRASGSNIQAENQQTQIDSTPMRQYVKVTPAAGFNSYVLPNTTVDQKVKNFAKHLSGQLTNYVNNPYDESQYIVEGINKDSVANFSNYINNLSEISNRAATPEDILKLGEIVSALGNEDLTNAFESYFAKELAGSEESEQQVQPVQNQTEQQTTQQTIQPQPEPNQPSITEQPQEVIESTITDQNTELLSKIKDISDQNLNFVGTYNIAAPIPFIKPILIKDIISVDGQEFNKSLQEFVKLYISAENGDNISLNTIKNKFKRISEKHGLYAAGDEIIQELKRTGKYKQIVKYCLLNSQNEKERELLLKELQKPTNYNMKTIITNSPVTTYFSSSRQQSYPTSRRTYSEKSGGKLDKLQNYINNKNGK